MCDDFWDTADAQVVCRQLGYPTSNAVAFGSAHFGQGNGSIYLIDVDCLGNESTLFNCNYSISYNCSGYEHVGVRCVISKYVYI